MHSVALCHKLLSGTTHLKRLNTLSEVIDTSLNHKTLAVTQLARKLKGRAKTKSNIRKVDRLLSNDKMMSDVPRLYKAMNSYMLRNLRPYLNVDGSKLLNSKFYTLRATLQLKGRGITIFETIYEQSEQCSAGLYKRFLDGLANVIPENVCPILVSDAEFRVPWFKLVLEHGWDYIGRVRGNKNIALDSNRGDFIHVKSLFNVWKLERAKALGYGLLNKTNSLGGYFYQFKARPKGRHAYTRSSKHSETEKSKKYTKSYKEAWVLFSSLEKPASLIVKAYKNRMTIEENFRDTKSVRFGLGLDMTRSKKKKRYVIMLMIAMIASAIAYIIGTMGEISELHYDYQANSIKSKRILSRFFLGCEMIFREYKFRFEEFLRAIHFCVNEVAYDE